MGVYLVSVDADEWFGAEEDGFGELAAALDAALVQRGLPPFDSLPGEAEFVRGSGLSFEEKLSAPMEGFAALCEEHLAEAEAETLCGWTVLVPFSLDGELRLPVPSAYFDETVVVGAPQALALAERLAALLELPLDEIPATSDNLELTLWFRSDGPAPEAAARRPGRWAADLDTAFHVALHLRAAQHSIRRNCPLTYC
ncbi:hypothetical protein [Streptacidiphilus anmyonensis]|uniref:hypothetical protein n=1 Tax=Streptacidiphilus anmyonensis TaxID=405782 RepID=UPI0005AA56E1|nr:hypothetical protein [Streptacidiphilus anmyonensis]